MPRPWFLLACGLIICLGLAAAGWLVYEGFPGNTWRSAPVIGSLLVAAGWMVTNLNTMRSSEIEHTLKLLADYGTSPESKRRWDLINTCNPRDTVLEPPASEGIAPGYKDIYTALEEELDSCEYIATGILRGVYDSKMLRHELEPDFFMLYRFGQKYIEAERRDDAQYWIRFTTVCEKWGVIK